jgi:hypothetical protein
MVGHAWAGGAVSLGLMLMASIPVLLVARLLTKREVPLGSMVAFMALGQAWVHLAAMSHQHTHITSPLRMLAGHSLAAVIAGLVLRQREATIWAKERMGLLRAKIGVLLGRVGVLVPSAALSTNEWLACRDLSVTASALATLPARRGPPA